MKKRLVIIFIVCILFLTVITMNSNLALTESEELSGDLYITSVEPIQVIEDADTLVTNKATVLRLVIHSTFTTEKRVVIKSTYDFGTKTYFDKAAPPIGVPIAPGENLVYTPGGPSQPARTSTWNPHGFFKWTHKGLDGSLKVELDPENNIEETDETNNIKFADTIKVANAPQFRVLFVPVAFTEDEDWSISIHETNEQMEYIRKTYPIAETDLVYRQSSLWRYDFPRKENRNWLFEVVSYPIACVTRIMGYHRVVIGMRNIATGVGGIAIGMLRTPSIREPVLCRFGVYDPVESLVAHEIGHTYYLWHPHDIGPPIYTAEKYDVLEQDYEEVVNTFMSYRNEPTWIDKNRYDGNPKQPIPAGTIIHCAGDPELDKDPFDMYLPVSTYQWNLVNQLTEEPPKYTCIIVHGKINDDNTINLDHSWYTIEGVTDFPVQSIKTSHNEKTYRIVFLNEYHQPIKWYEFPVSFQYVVHDDKTGDLINMNTNSVPFLFNVPKTADVRYIQIQNENYQTLAEREITLNSPIVQVISPNGGEKFRLGNTITINWKGFDQDQDSLRYTLGYSNDNGNTWIPLAFDTEETTFEWNTQGLEEGDYLVKVIASDGVNTGEDISDAPFQLPKNKEKTINTPFLKFLENYPIIYQIIQRILKL